MFTATEKKYLALTLFFLLTGSGIKAYRQSQVSIGPMDDVAFHKSDSLSLVNPHLDSVPKTDSTQVSQATVAVSELNSGHIPHYSTLSKVKATFTGKVALNHADANALMAIRGIGEKTAGFILEYRHEHGPFQSLQGLLEVKGIGEKKLEKIIPFLIL